MGQQYDVFHVDQFLRHFRFRGEHVEAGRKYGFGFQRLDEGRLVNDRAPRNVDQNTIRPQRLQNFAVDHIFGCCTARHDDNEDIDIARHRDEVGVMFVADVHRLLSAVIDDRQIKRFEPLCNRFSDPSHAYNTDGAVSQRVRFSQ